MVSLKGAVHAKHDEPLEPTGAPIAPPDTVRAGTEEWWVEAGAAFAKDAVEAYVPSPESDKLRVSLAPFEGPLGLLLHLLDKHALDVFDIPIAQITKEYLAAIDDMRALDLDVA